VRAKVTNAVPKLSIGMPVFNGAKYIHEALDSLLAQTFRDFELVISDNASTDDTQTICEKYALRDSRIRYVRQAENMGALANFKFVLDQARGEFFMFAAADDVWDSHWIETILSNIAKEENVAGFSKLVHIDEFSKIVAHPANNCSCEFTGPVLWRKICFYIAFEGLGKANLFYAIYPKDVLKRIDILNYQYDYQMIFSLLDEVEFRQVGNASFYKRIHAECASCKLTSFSSLPPAVRLLWRLVSMPIHYVHKSKPHKGALLVILIPVKIMVSIKFYLKKLLLSR
jgi:glycosyltransferase involved in cell wall biosynthesis